MDQVRLDEEISGLNPVDIVDDVVWLSRHKLLRHVDHLVQRKRLRDSKCALWPNEVISATLIVVGAGVSDTCGCLVCHIHAMSKRSAMQCFVESQPLSDDRMPVRDRAAVPRKECGILLSRGVDFLLETVHKSLFLVRSALGESELHPTIHPCDTVVHRLSDL